MSVHWVIEAENTVVRIFVSVFWSAHYGKTTEWNNNF